MALVDLPETVDLAVTLKDNRVQYFRGIGREDAERMVMAVLSPNGYVHAPDGTDAVVIPSRAVLSVRLLNVVPFVG